MSPENAFRTSGADCTLSMGCTADTILVRELFQGFLEVVEALGAGHPLESNVRRAMEKLPPFRQGQFGQLQEWFDDFEEADPHHRHTSHLLSVYPFRQIGRHTPEWLPAVRASLDRKTTPPDLWEDTGWARSLLALYEARLGYGERASGHLDALLEQLAYPNLLIRHPPVAGAHSSVFELDGNTGLTAAAAEMLLQSSQGRIEVLPAIPADWGEGWFEGLRAQGGWTVCCRWNAGHEIQIRLRPDGDASVTLVSDGQEVAVDGRAGLWFQWTGPYRGKGLL